MCWRAARGYLKKQHPTCHQAWTFYLLGNVGSEEDPDYADFEPLMYDLLCDLGTMARRDALNLSIKLEENGGNSPTRTDMTEVREPVFSVFGMVHL